MLKCVPAAGDVCYSVAKFKKTHCVGILAAEIRGMETGRRWAFGEISVFYR